MKPATGTARRARLATHEGLPRRDRGVVPRSRGSAPSSAPSPARPSGWSSCARRSCRTRRSSSARSALRAMCDAVGAAAGAQRPRAPRRRRRAPTASTSARTTCPSPTRAPLLGPDRADRRVHPRRAGARLGRAPRRRLRRARAVLPLDDEDARARAPRGGPAQGGAPRGAAARLRDRRDRLGQRAACSSRRAPTGSPSGRASSVATTRPPPPARSPRRSTPTRAASPAARSRRRAAARGTGRRSATRTGSRAARRRTAPRSGAGAPAAPEDSGRPGPRQGHRTDSAPTPLTRRVDVGSMRGAECARVRWVMQTAAESGDVHRPAPPKVA